MDRKVFVQCQYELLDVSNDNFNLYLASSNVAAWICTIFLCTLYFLPNMLAIEISMRL